MQVLRLQPRAAGSGYLFSDARADGGEGDRGVATGRYRGLHPGRTAARSAQVSLPGHSAGGEEGGAADAYPRVLADGDCLWRGTYGDASGGLSLDAEGQRSRDTAWDGSGNSGRRDP